MNFNQELVIIRAIWPRLHTRLAAERDIEMESHQQHQQIAMFDSEEMATLKLSQQTPTKSQLQNNLLNLNNQFVRSFVYYAD